MKLFKIIFILFFDSFICVYNEVHLFVTLISLSSLVSSTETFFSSQVSFLYYSVYV